MKQAAEEFFTVIFTSLLTAFMVLLLFEIRDLKPAAIEEPQPQIEQVRDIPNNKFYTEWDIVYVESIDDGWVVSTKQYGDLFIQMTYTQAITFASVLTYIGYSCDYSCKEEMLGKTILEFNQRMYYE